MKELIVVMLLVLTPVISTLYFLGSSAEPMKQGIKCLVDTNQCKK